jgi:glucoamylase
VKNRVLTAAAGICTIAACLVPSVATGASRHAAPRAGASSVAPGAPGSESYFDLARKDCVGTARNERSKVWFTVADGVLSDTYWPTADATNVKTLQYLVTDGHSFTDLQTRDMTYRVLDDPTGMACTVIATSAAHHYRITTTYLPDPSRDAVLMRTQFDGPRSDQLYVRLDPLAGGTGGGGTDNAGANTAAVVGADGGQTLLASNPNTTTEATNRSYAVATDEALRSSGGLRDASVGYAGSPSDGLMMLDARHQLTPYDSAPNGHVTLTARVPLRRRHRVTLALGFGTSQTAALDTAGDALNQNFGAARAHYEAQWQRYDAGLRRPSRSLGAAARREYDESVNVVKASEDKTFPGAIVAGLASPWGQAVSAGASASDGKPPYFGSYREVFSRDLYEAFTALLLAGDGRSARDADRFLFDRQQQPDGSMPRNSLLNGMAAPDTGGLQLDETAYPILMDWQSGLARDTGLYRQHVIPAADFLVAHGPSDGNERWEEQSGYSPSTIAAEIAGLTAAARIAAVQGDTVHSAVYQATADHFARNIKSWTVTSTGPYAASYFIRLSKSGDPNAADTLDLGNGSITVDQRTVVDAGFLELVRLGVLPASDPTVRASLGVVDATIERSTPGGPGFYRYGTSGPGSEDGYGDCYEPDPTTCSPSGKPWPTTGNVGSGHLWPVLSGERGGCPDAARRDGRDDLRPGARARAGLGGSAAPTLPVRQRPDHRLDRLRTRPARRLGQSAHVGAGPVRASRPGSQQRPQPRDPGDRDRPLCRPRHAGQTGADRDLAGQRSDRRRQHRHRDRDHGARRHGGRPGRRPDGRRGRDGLGDRRLEWPLDADTADHVRHLDDHGHRHVGSEHRLCPALGHQRPARNRRAVGGRPQR